MNGFRCVKYIDREKIPSQAFEKIPSAQSRDISKEKPVSDDIFNVFKNEFLYDKKDLKAEIEDKDAGPEYWTVEKISFNAAYENERMIAYLFLPKNGSPPFQTVIYLPGSYAQSEKDLASSVNSLWFIDYILKNNRAVMYPVYLGTFERSFTRDFTSQSRQYVNYNIKITQDLCRSIDYLETRPDIDTARLAYYGDSWGGRMGLIIPAVEERLKLSILIVGGSTGKPFPELDPVNYLPRIKIPVLMLNGKYDASFPYETAVKPFFDILGTADKNKRLVLYNTDHYIPKSDIIKESLNWLDKYFGPAK
jgi:dienelactone hydrolase